MHKIGEDSSEKLEFIPAKVKVIEHVRPKYACRECEKSGTSNSVKQAPVPKSIIPKGYATPSLVSQIIISKYQYGLPLYRQESMFKQYGIELSRKTMADWMMRSGDILQVLFDYHASRAGQCAVDFLDDYQGYLQVDGYAGYHTTQATLVGCWAHARRKFTDAKTAQGKKQHGKADWALNHIQKLYRIEIQIKDKTIEARHRIRQEKSLPLLKQFKAWLTKSKEQVLPKTKLGEAITYSVNQWQKLQGYTLDGRLNIDNNRAERAIKPFVIGRKNWLFSQAAKGAQASAVLYSIIETRQS